MTLYNEKYTLGDLLNNRDIFDENYVEKNIILYNLIYEKYQIDLTTNKNINILAIYEREKNDIIELEKYPHSDLTIYGDFTNIYTIFQSQYKNNSISKNELKKHHKKLLSMTFINQKIKFKCNNKPTHNYCKNICDNKQCEYQKIINNLRSINIERITNENI